MRLQGFQKNKVHGIELSNLYVHRDQCSEVVNGLSEVRMHQIEINSFNFTVGLNYGAYS